MSQLGVNSPFKSGADYWRETSEPLRKSSNSTEGLQAPLLAPVGHLFDFRAGLGPGAGALSRDASESSLPAMPEWLYRRPHLTGEDLLKVGSCCEEQYRPCTNLWQGHHTVVHGWVMVRFECLLLHTDR